jgi:hypothetical protein
MTQSDRLLRLALRGNAAFSTTCALIGLIASAPLASALGVPNAGVLVGLAAQLLVFAAFLVWLSRRPQIHPAVALGVILADVAWVVGTVPVVAGGTLTTAGVWTALAVADVVALFAVLQGVGLRRMRRAALA